MKIENGKEKLMKTLKKLSESESILEIDDRLIKTINLSSLVLWKLKESITMKQKKLKAEIK